MSTTTTAPAGPGVPAAPYDAPSTSAGLVTTAGPAVIGDGTTAGSRARRRWRSARWPLVGLLVLALAALVASLITPETSTTPFAPDSPVALGSRAVAEVLTDQGVEIDYVRTSGEALRTAQAGTTLLVAGTYLLTDEQVTDLAATEADLVLAGVEGWQLDGLTEGALVTRFNPEAGLRSAACADPGAVAAGTVDASGGGSSDGFVAGRPDVEVCFPGGEGDGLYAAYADGGRRVVVLGDIGMMTNERVTAAGHAALVLRALGANERLVWYVPSMIDTGGTAEPGAAPATVLPPWTDPLAVWALLLVLALALWRGRGMGRIVTEPLPVTVRAAETALGRGRLYRRGRSRGHAAAALRAGVARRAAARLGLPRAAGAVDVIDALTRATGRDTEQVTGLRYGPPPTDDAGLLLLARQLDELESEVHRT